MSFTIPAGLGDLDSIKRRESAAFNRDLKWHDMLQDAYEFFLPNRNLFEETEKGQKKQENIFDSLPLIAIQSAASKIQENIAPIWSTWADLGPSFSVLKQLEDASIDVSERDIRDRLQKNRDIAFDFINRSNFSTQFYESAIDLLIGTSTIKVDENLSNENPLSFRTIPQKGVAFEEGPDGNVNTHFRKLSVPLRNVERLYPGFVLSSEMRSKMNEDDGHEIKISEAFIFNPKDGKYYAIVWERGEDFISWAEDFGDTNRMITARYTKVSGEIRGRGPAIQALPDVKTINKIREFGLRKAAIDLAGIWTVTDDGVTNPYNIQVAPGVFIPVGSNNSQNPSIQRLDTSGDLRLVQFEIQEIKNTIREAFFMDLRDPAGPVRSATEVAIESRELAKRIGSAFGRLQTEMLVPILEASFSILARRGLIDPIKVNGSDISVKFTSPLARAQDAEDLNSIQQAVDFTAATAGPERVMMAFKLEDFGNYAAEKTGMPQELVRSDAEKRSVIEAGAAQAQAQNQPQEPQNGLG